MICCCRQEGDQKSEAVFPPPSSAEVLQDKPDKVGISKDSSKAIPGELFGRADPEPVQEADVGDEYIHEFAQAEDSTTCSEQEPGSTNFVRQNSANEQWKIIHSSANFNSALNPKLVADRLLNIECEKKQGAEQDAGPQVRSRRSSFRVGTSVSMG
eukprot:gnl/MRDRNA2_/MRDRNA2_35424_c0_seq1.p1 gnl/MRDRNA2_/MRDRNA2_35424_c0~~gnl/MRDRNA2_/MRDRNA2_35424_c0_seq1.p1  ORF type:complete len:156 (+),score=27.97 gnl/MRDRNA2_/MRDRNA2_35424_c0_seq1:99-566(+)